MLIFLNNEVKHCYQNKTVELKSIFNLSPVFNHKGLGVKMEKKLSKKIYGIKNSHNAVNIPKSKQSIFAFYFFLALKKFYFREKGGENFTKYMERIPTQWFTLKNYLSEKITFRRNSLSTLPHLSNFSSFSVTRPKSQINRKNRFNPPKTIAPCLNYFPGLIHISLLFPGTQHLISFLFSKIKPLISLTFKIFRFKTYLNFTSRFNQTGIWYPGKGSAQV